MAAMACAAGISAVMISSSGNNGCEIRWVLLFAIISAFVVCGRAPTGGGSRTSARRPSKLRGATVKKVMFDFLHYMNFGLKRMAVWPGASCTLEISELYMLYTICILRKVVAS